MLVQTPLTMSLMEAGSKCFSLEAVNLSESDPNRDQTPPMLLQSRKISRS